MIILCGFAAHGLRTKFHASLRIATGFLGATGAVAAVQAWTLVAGAETAAQRALLASLLLAAVAGRRLFCLLRAAEEASAGFLVSGESGNLWG